MAKIEGDHIKFLGTAGARFVMIKQLRCSGGIWVSCKGSNVLIDPGPGSIARMAASKPVLDPARLDAIILTHKHLDHSGDINVMIEGMTEGGFKKRGCVFAPADALDADPVIFQYLRGFPAEIQLLAPKHSYSVGEFNFKASMRHVHPVETYGIKFKAGDASVGLLVDTKFFDGLIDFYRTDILIIGVVFLEPHPAIDHLCLAEAEKLIGEIRPKLAVLTHFGMSMLKAKPDKICDGLSRRLAIKVKAAYDGMTLPLP